MCRARERTLATCATHSPRLNASLTSCSPSAGGERAVSLPAITTPNGVAMHASSMIGLGGLPTTTCRPARFTFLHWKAEGLQQVLVADHATVRNARE